MAHLTETRTAHLPLFGRFAELRATIAERIAAYRSYRATFAELSALSDRELEDLGICRGDIHQISRESALDN